MSAFKDFHNFKDFCCVKIYDFTYKIFLEELCNFKKKPWCFRFSKDFMNVREVEVSFVKM
jgi:hypothetical protein